MPAKPSADAPILIPFRIVIDTREKTPFHFVGLRGDAREKRRPLQVPTVVRGLPSGDYSIEGYETQLAIERKSLADLYGTIAQGRDRFERELGRLNGMEFAAIVIEADWQSIINGPPKYTKLPPKIVFRSIIAWMQRFKGVHWCPMNGRRLAEVWTFRHLERFWKDHQPKAK